MESALGRSGISVRDDFFLDLGGHSGGVPKAVEIVVALVESVLILADSFLLFISRHGQA